MTASHWLEDIDGLLVDWDGTVVDSLDANFTNLADVLARHDVTLNRAWYDGHAGLALGDLLEQVRHRYPRLPPVNALTAACRARRAAAGRPPQLVAATAALLDTAHTLGIPCAVATGAVRVVVQAEIAALALTKYFAALVALDDVPRGKPAPDLFLAAAQRLEVPAHRCVAIDDSADGIAAAYAAGISRVLTLRAGTIVLTDQA